MPFREGMTSVFFCGLGKKKLWKAFFFTDTEPFETFVECPKQTISDELITSSKALVIRAYGGSEDATLGGLKTQNFLTRIYGLLSLPPTEDALKQHIRRAALADIMRQSPHTP